MTLGRFINRLMINGEKIIVAVHLFHDLLKKVLYAKFEEIFA